MFGLPADQRNEPTHAEVRTKVSWSEVQDCIGNNYYSPDLDNKFGDLLRDRNNFNSFYFHLRALVLAGQ